MDAFADRSIDFTVEIHEARRAVQIGSVTVADVFDSLLPLSSMQARQMIACLERIDSGACPTYPNSL